MSLRGIRATALACARPQKALRAAVLDFRSTRSSGHGRSSHSTGQSLVEFALVAPVLLLLTLTALDFGRVYLGWINLQSATRAASNYAANNADAWLTNDTTRITRYRNQVLNDTANTNCTLTPGTPADPVFSDGNGDGKSHEIGDRATASFTCAFTPITPIISNIVGSTIAVSAAAMFPINTGQFATSGGTGPTAAYAASPTTTTTGTNIAFTDTSTGTPTTWLWDFGDATTASTQHPTHAYAAAGTYSVTLTVTNANGSNALTKTNYITVTTPTPTADFTATKTNPAAGEQITFTGTLTGGTATGWAWTFGDGGTSTVGPTVSKVYNAAGTYTVRLVVTSASGSTTVTKTNYMVVTAATCVVPSFFGTSTSGAQALWNSRGFTTTVTYKQGGTPWTIQSQNIVANSSVPCNSVIQVSRN